MLGLRNQKGTENELTFNNREATFTIGNWDFWKLNAEHSGFYRTLYNPRRLDQLGKNAKAGLLPVSDRTGLICDAGALAEAGYQKTSDLLSLLQLFDSETDCEVWLEIILRLKNLRDACKFEDDGLTAGLEAFQRSLVCPQAHQLGWTFTIKDDHVQQRYKALMFGAACSAGDEIAKSAALDMFTKFKGRDRDAIHSSLRIAVYKTVLRYGGEDEYDTLIEELRRSMTPDDRQYLLASLGATQDPKLLQRTLDFVVSGEISTMDIFEAIQEFSEHRDGVQALWTWMSDNLELLYEIGHAIVGFGMLVFTVVSPFTQDHQRQIVQDFFRAKDTKVFDMSLVQALDVINVKHRWLVRDKADIAEWLNRHGHLQSQSQS